MAAAGERLNIPVAVTIETENLNTIRDRGSYIRNGIIRMRSDQVPFVQQRPPIQIQEDASEENVDTRRARGIFFWENTGSLYFINDDTIYLTSYQNPLVSTISAGKEKVHMVELGNNLVIIDPENNEGWTLDNTNTLTKITDASFPSTLAGGVVELDGFIFVVDEDGVIHHSALDDPTTWSALDTVTAEREDDEALFIAQHQDQIVYFGTKSVEVFYNAANPTGSVLSRREDVSYSIAADSHNSFFVSEDDILFVGVNQTGNVGVYFLGGMKLDRISNPTIDSFLTNERVNKGKEFICSGQVIGGKIFFFLSVCRVDENASEQEIYVPEDTLVYDFEIGAWYLWDTAIFGHADFGIVSTSVRTSASPRIGEGIFLNGDLYQPKYTDFPIDTNTTALYVEDGYVVEGYVETSTTLVSENIVFTIRTLPVDAGGRHNKFMKMLEFVGNYSEDDDNEITISYSDNYYKTFVNRKVMKSPRDKLTRLGKFNRRVFQINYSGDRLLRVERLEAKINHGKI